MLEKFNTKAKKSIWINLYRPKDEEIRAVEKQYNITLPFKTNLGELETSNRCYIKDHVAYFKIKFLADDFEKTITKHNLLLIVKDNILITLSYSPSSVLNTMRSELKKNNLDFSDGADVMHWIIRSEVSRMADFLEELESRANTTMRNIRLASMRKKEEREEQELHNILLSINCEQELLYHTFQALMSQELILDLMPEYFDEEKLEQLKSERINTDVKDLIEFCSALSSNLDFMLNSSLGLINIEQNIIMKIFTIVSTVILPPSLIAGIYGMNFTHMPELHHKMSYPIVWMVMLGSAMISFFYIKKKGWI